MTVNEIKRYVQENLPELLEYRRHLHSYPELSFKETETTKYIMSILDHYSVSYTVNTSGTGLVARIDGLYHGKVLAFRTDIDALPIKEETNLPYASKNEGIMHACGHDIHMTAILGLCIFLALHKETIKGSVVFIFQHAEEVYPGGANAIIQSGILKDVDAFYGFHVDPTLVTGQIACISGPAMASPTTFHCSVCGKGGHGAKPHETIDPIVIASQIICAFQSIISRKINPLDTAVISCCQIHSGTTDNVIPDIATFSGTIRTFSDSVRDTIVQSIKNIATQISTGMGGTCDITFEYGYPTLINPKEHAAHVIKAVKDSGYEVVSGTPTMVGEDFAYYLKYRPGAFFFLGIKNPNDTSICGLHNASLVPDEQAITVAVETCLSIYYHALDS